MTIKYSYNKAESYVHCILEGVVPLQEVMDYVDKLAADPEIDKPFVEVVDLLKLSRLDFGYSESSALMARYKHLGHYCASIFIVDGDYLKGIANQFLNAGEQRDITLEEVTSLEQALIKVPLLLS